MGLCRCVGWAENSRNFAFSSLGAALLYNFSKRTILRESALWSGVLHVLVHFPVLQSAFAVLQPVFASQGHGRSPPAPLRLLGFSSGSPPVLLRFSSGSPPVFLRFSSGSSGSPPVLLRFSSGSPPVPPVLLRFSSGSPPVLLRPRV